MKKPLVNVVTLSICFLVLTAFPCTAKAQDFSKNSTTLVAYFSCTGTTERIAEMIVEHTGAAVYRITPETPYTAEDLNYRDSSSRSSREHSDPTIRPGIADPLPDLEQYDVVFLGYPLWWGQAPNIIHTFIESHDFAGKTVIPFATSASSPLGSSDTNLHSVAPTAVWLPGRRFSRQSTNGDVGDWVSGIPYLDADFPGR